MCVEKGRLKDNIIEKQYKDPMNYWVKILEKHPNLNIFTECVTESLYDTNTEIIKKACEVMDIKTTFLEDYKTSFKGTQRLVDICVHYGANEYLSGISGRHYLDVSLFKHHGIKVIFQDEKDMIKQPLVNIL